MTIRRQPDDFVVREHLTIAALDRIKPDPASGHAHAVFRLTKASLATPEAVSKLAKALGVRAQRVSYAGLKDKHARTVQHVAVEPEPTGKPPRATGLIAGEAWEAESIGFTDAPLSADAIEANEFTIAVTDLSREASDEMARRADAFWTEAHADTDRAGLLIVNYFGDQRFGGARHRQGWIGRALIEGDFENALRLAVATPARKDAGRVRVFTRMAAERWGDWPGLAKDLPLCPERRAFEALAAGADFKRAFVSLPYFTQQMAVEAYQSHLWNRAAALLAERLGGAPQNAPALRGGAGVIRTPDPFGEMIFPLAWTVEQTLGPDWPALSLPLLARKTTLDPQWAWAVERVLAEEQLEQSRLTIPGLHRPYFGEAPRPLLVLAAGFSMSGAEPDEIRPGRWVRRVSFRLPRGAYATVVLRALGQ
ncbi:MAG: tRNA pseudouridine(13) synthase TruD [Phycisphaerales bacterium]